MNEVKVPCGGFKLGAGLNLNGDVVEPNVKIYKVGFGSEQISSGTWRYFFKEDSQIQNYEQLLELYGTKGDRGSALLVDSASGNFYQVRQNSDLSYNLIIQWWRVEVDAVSFGEQKYLVNTDSTIELSQNVVNISKS